jgi:predicted Rossmann-fold nucleotide-binding protein
VVTGGYGGLMRATAQAARNAGGQVVGLPMKEWRHLTPGEWNAELRWAADYPMRLGLMLRCEAVVALDGGVGTLSEMALAWAMAQTEEIAPALVLLGARWRRIVQHFGDELVINEDDLRLVHVVNSPEDAVALIQDQEALARPPRSRG